MGWQGREGSHSCARRPRLRCPDRPASYSLALLHPLRTPCQHPRRILAASLGAPPPPLPSRPSTFRHTKLPTTFTGPPCIMHLPRHPSLRPATYAFRPPVPRLSPPSLPPRQSDRGHRAGKVAPTRAGSQTCAARPANPGKISGQRPATRANPAASGPRTLAKSAASNPRPRATWASPVARTGPHTGSPLGQSHQTPLLAPPEDTLPKAQYHRFRIINIIVSISGGAP